MIRIQPFQFNMFPVNCYVLTDEDTNEAVIIDAGCYYADEQERLKDYIVKNNLKVVHLLNTHLHLDHIFGNAFVAREFHLKPEANQKDEFLIAKTETYCNMFGFPINEKPETLGGYIEDGDIIRFGKSQLKALYTPGHSPGGMVFYDEENACLFSGDVLFQCGMGRTDLDGGNFDDLMESIKYKIFTLPDNTTVYPGHGGTTTIGSEKMNNPYFR